MLDGEKQLQARVLLSMVANSAALAGFALGKVEACKAEKIGLASHRNRQLATAKNTNHHWRDAAKEIWAKHPKWTTHRVAKQIAQGDEDVSSVQRSIKKLAPETSPSFKP